MIFLESTVLGGMGGSAEAGILLTFRIFGFRGAMVEKRGGSADFFFQSSPGALRAPGSHLSSSWGPPAGCMNSVVVQLRSSALH